MKALRDIFCHLNSKKVFTSTELLAFELNPDFVDKLCKRLHLDYDESAFESNVCFASSSEVRADYRTSFNKFDIINFIKAEYPERKEYFSDTEVFFPEDPKRFWSVIESQ